MKIGLAYDLKDEKLAGPNSPEDALEEYDTEDTVVAIATALKARGHSVARLSGGREFLVNILKEKVDFVFNIAEGWGNYRSREAQVPSVLEMLAIPYSGADPQCLAICLDKPLTKQLLVAAGVPTPRWQVITEADQFAATGDSFPLPAFVKPAYEGSSKGIRWGSKVDSFTQMAEIADWLAKEYCQPVMVEEFIAGDEITVGVVGQPPRVLGIMRILPSRGDDPNFVYCLEVKRNWQELVTYECPAHLPEAISQQIAAASLKAFETLGCRDMARLDFRVSVTGQPYLLEVNPLPGLRPGYSDLPIMAAKMGYDYNSLVGLILNSALVRQQQCVLK